MAMRRIVLISLICLAINVSLLWITFFQRQEIVNANGFSKSDLIICFGGSLTAGKWVSIREGYPWHLARMLNRGIVLNAGIEGLTTEYALEILKTNILPQNPRMVVVELGREDFLNRIPTEKTFKNLRKIVSAIQKIGAMSVVIGIRMGVIEDEYSPLFRKLAEESGSLHIPNWLDGVMCSPEYRSNLHYPNNKGYRILAKRVARKIRPLLR
jgi:acyl-CoA hydrolase